LTEELKELKNIKKLLVLLLKSNDFQVEQIAKVLGVDQSAISHMLNPKSKQETPPA
jgi:predicted XRE-type DNA-binding protein